MSVEGVIKLKTTHAGYVVPITVETHKRIQKLLGGSSFDCDPAELCSFVFGTAQEFFEKAYCYDGNLQDVVEFFELRAEIARAIVDGTACRFVETFGEEE